MNVLLTVMEPRWLAPYIVQAAIQCSLLLIPALAYPARNRWRAYFQSLLVMTALPLAGYVISILLAVSQWKMVVPPLPLLLVLKGQPYLIGAMSIIWIVADRPSWPQRTWLHWVGMLTSIWEMYVLGLFAFLWLMWT